MSDNTNHEKVFGGTLADDRLGGPNKAYNCLTSQKIVVQGTEEGPNPFLPLFRQSMVTLRTTKI